MKKLILSFFFILFNVLSIWAQVDVGTGTSTQRFPFGNYYGFERSASLYTGDEIQSSGNITALAWDAELEGMGARPVKIYLKEVTARTLVSETWAGAIAGATLVYEGSMTPVVGWNTTTLTTPFNYTGGENNLLVLVEVNTGGGGAGSAVTNVNGNKFKWTIAIGRHMTLEKDNTAPETTGSVNASRPNIRISLPAPTCLMPVLFSNTTITATTAGFEVSLPVAASGYEYEVRTSGAGGSGSVGLVQTSSISTNSFEVSGLAPNTLYNIYLRAKCTTTDFSMWKAVSFTTFDIGQIGTGELTAFDLPIKSNYGYNYSQQIYLKAEVASAVGTNNLIKKIKFHFKSTNTTANYKDWKIFMGNTTNVKFASNTSWIPQSGLTEVFNGEVTFPDPTDDWMEIELVNPFVWDGVSNLVIAVNEYTPDYTSGGFFRKFQTLDQRGLGYAVDAANPDFANMPAGALFNYVPQLKLEGDPLPDCVAPLAVTSSDLTSSSVKYTWNIYGSTPVLGTEYFLSTSSDTPDPDTADTEMIIAPITELLLTGLTENTRYYIWFRVKCSETLTSEWSSDFTFRTNSLGQIGTGESLTTSLPIQSNFSYNYSQQIYLANEVLGAIGTDRYIHKIKFHFSATTATENYKDWKIFMGNTSKATFATTTAAEWVPIASLTTVFDGEITFPNPSGDWIEIELTEPFLWDGISNIVVGVHEKTPESTSGASFRRMDTGDDYRGLIYRVNAVNSNPNPTSPPAASDRFKFVPQIVLKTMPVPGCVGVSSYSFTDLTFNSVKLKWTNTLTTMMATEYFYSTALTNAPTANTAPTGTVTAPLNEVLLNNLQPDTQYYVWFRNQCTGATKSEWSAIPLNFKTKITGLIGQGEAAATSLPIQSNYAYNYSQQIYLASEVRAAIGGTGQQSITKLKFHISTSGLTDQYKDWEIFVGNTAKTEFTATAADQWITVPNMQQVFSGVVVFPDPTAAWMEITFTEAFAWDGTSNIVVGVHENTSGYGTLASFRKMDTPTNRGIIYRSDYTIANPNNPVAASTSFSFVPQVVFETGLMPACLKPIFVGVDEVTKNTATINWTAPITVPTAGYEYEIRTAAAPGSGATGLVATGIEVNTVLLKTISGLLPSTEYSVYVRSKCAATTNSDWTRAIKFTTLCDYVDFAVQNAAICGQGIVTLTVDVTGTTGVFKWYDVATGGVSLGEGLTFTTPLLTATKSYWVEGIAANACMTSRKKIDVVVSAAPELTLSTAALTICEGETSAVVAVTSDVSTYNTFTWSPATGVSGNAQIGWVFNPETTTEYVLVAKQVGGDTCEIMKKVQISVKKLPVVSVSPAEENLILCEGTIRSLEASFAPTYEANSGAATTVSGDTDNNTAFNNRWNSGKSQLLFTAAELSENGIMAGDISALSFNIATPGSTLINANYTVKIATTTLSNFTTATYETTGFTTVYGPDTYTHTDSGWQEIVFATPYVWDGVSNLIIEIASSGANSTNNAQTYHTATTNNSLLFSYNTNAPSLSKLRYNVLFKGVNNYQVTWSPVANVFTDAMGTVPYIAGASAKKVYYKAQTEGFEDVVMNVSSGNGCPLLNTFNIRTVVITDAQAQDQEFCGVTRVSDLEAIGQDGAGFKWYRQATGGAALAETTVLTTGTYFVTQIIGACESVTRVPVMVTIKDKPVAPILPNRNICGSAVLSDLDVTYDPANTLTWYDVNENEIVGDINLVTGIYYVSQSNSVCESVKTRVNISVNAIPTAPTAPGSQVYCGASRVSNLVVQLAPGAVANWYTSLESTTSLSPNELLRTGIYYVAQMTNSCESTRIAVNVSIYDMVALPAVQNQNFCTDHVTVADLVVTALPGATVSWYNTANGGVALGANQTLNSGLYFVSQKIGECESGRVRIGVNIVSNNTAPNAVEQSFCDKAKVADLHATVATGMILKWYTQEQGGTELTADTALQTGVYYVSQSIYFCESPRRSVKVTINAIPATPTGSALQIFEEEENGVLGDLVMDQANVVWFSTEEDAQNNNNVLSANMPLIDGNVYFAVLRSANGCSSLAFAVTVEIKKTVGVNDFDLSKLNYFPNPVRDVLTITYKETITRVEVYSFTGQRVLTVNSADNVVKVDMNRLAPATYVVKIYSNDQSQFIKIIKN